MGALLKNPRINSRIKKTAAPDLVHRWIRDLRGLLGTAPLVVSEVRVGVFYTAAQISTGHVGVAFTPRMQNDSVCCPKSAAAAPPAGTLAGCDAWGLALFAIASVPLRRSVGVAVLNALSALAIERHGTPGGHLERGLDALDAADIRPHDRVVMVGVFTPFLKKLKGNVAGLRVIDNHPEALQPDELGIWCSPYKAAEALADANVVIISGSALVEGDLDALLLSTTNARHVVLAGPTASPWPPTFFESGIDLLGGLRVLDAPKIMQIVGEGGSGYFFGDAAEKVCIVRDGGASARPLTHRGHTSMNGRIR
jgi:uncharacterized protein (DUF4213/DUF364 family)